jgi:hypothetical protein
VNADGTYTFTPNANWNGIVPVITYTVSDGNGGTDTGTLAITVTAVNDSPVAVNDDNQVTPEDTPIIGNVLANDSDPEGNPITVSQFTVAGVSGTFAAGQTATIPGVGTIVINSDGSYVFTPAANYSGAVPVITYTAADSYGGSDTANLGLAVTPVNDAPLAVDDIVSGWKHIDCCSIYDQWSNVSSWNNSFNTGCWNNCCQCKWNIYIHSSVGLYRKCSRYYLHSCRRSRRK